MRHTFIEWLALQENDNWFYNKKHLEQELNRKINSGLLKGLNQHDLNYVVIDDHKDTADVYVGDFGDLSDEVKKKLVPAAKYFLQDMGVELGQEKTDPSDPVIVSIPILNYPRYESEPDQWSHLDNPIAAQRLKSGEAIDVADIGIEISPGIWKLNNFIDGTDYYDSKNQDWIWSIGKDKNTGEIYASIDTRFYNSEDANFPYETLWLR